MQIEFEFQSLPAVSKPKLTLEYRGRKLRKSYEPDFTCYDKILLEIKAASKLVDEHRAQMINYLKSTGFSLGLLVNLGAVGKLEWERLVNTKTDPTIQDPPTLQT